MLRHVKEPQLVGGHFVSDLKTLTTSFIGRDGAASACMLRVCGLESPVSPKWDLTELQLFLKS